MTRRGTGQPETGKLRTARWVEAPYRASEGTSMGPMVSFSVRVPVPGFRLRGVSFGMVVRAGVGRFCTTFLVFFGVVLARDTASSGSGNMGGIGESDWAGAL